VQAAIGNAVPSSSGALPSLARVPAALPLVAAALLIAVLFPVGYVGGGGDDWQYLIAAECWAAQGPCLPHDHWETRWPVIAPLAAVIRAFGESRATLAIVPLAYAAAALILMAHLVTLVAGRRAALLGGGALLLTPAIAITLTKINVDVAELTFLLATLAAWLAALDRGSRRWAVAAGLFLALAVQTRETSLIHGLTFAVWFLVLPVRQKKVMIWSLAGFAAPIGVEAVIFAAAAGDPLLRFTLAGSHTEIPTASLAPGAEGGGSVLFNFDRMRAYVPASGIDVHWALNPILNLLAEPVLGVTAATAVLLLVSRRDTSRSDRGRAFCRWALIATVATTLVLIYVLSINARPRMVLPLLAALAATIGIAGAELLRRDQKLLAAFLAASFVAVAALQLLIWPRIGFAEPVAARWIEEAGHDVTTDETTRRHLALVPAARALRVAGPPLGHVLALGFGQCDSRAPSGFAAVRSYRASQAQGPIARAAHGILARGQPEQTLCLYRQVTPGARSRPGTE